MYSVVTSQEEGRSEKGVMKTETYVRKTYLPVWLLQRLRLRVEIFDLEDMNCQQIRAYIGR
jgi:hypothetical protein